MAKYWRLLAEYDAEATTYGACAGGGGSSPYTPDKSGRLIGLRTMVGDDAATSLVNHGNFKLTCSTFTPNVIEVGFQGTGLRTVPAFMQHPIDWAVDQPVQAGVPITIEARHLTADTPVTASVLIFGLFE
jgi:hypothetical protein